ncbi:MAG: hypothetical protein E6J52_03510 [Chloroflexi bacterium]|nr:MAG: hypothetical protein E6J52_03510 [Chloroflexota bacterium]
MKAPGVARHRLLPPLAAWILGMAIGIVGTWLVLFVPIYALPVYIVLAAVLVLRGPRAAFGGAILLATGLWLTYVHFSMLARCAAANSATGSCQVVDANGTAVPALTFVLVGAALSIYALLGKRSSRAGE